MSDGAYIRPPIRNHSRIHSEPNRGAHRISPLGPVRIVEEAVRDIRDSVRINLESLYSSESSPEPELHPNITVERVIPFEDTDASLLNNNPDENILHPLRDDALSEIVDTISRTSHRREFSLTSYDGSIFNPEEIYAALEISQQDMAQTNPPVEARRVTSEEIETEVNRLRSATRGTPANDRTPEQAMSHLRIREILDELLEGMQTLQSRMNRIEAAGFNDPRRTNIYARSLIRTHAR